MGVYSAEKGCRSLPSGFANAFVASSTNILLISLNLDAFLMRLIEIEDRSIRLRKKKYMLHVVAYTTSILHPYWGRDHRNPHPLHEEFGQAFSRVRSHCRPSPYGGS